MSDEANKPGRPWWRRGLRYLFLVCAIYLTPVLVGCMNLSTPMDYLLNVGWYGHRPELQADNDGQRHLIVMQHGIARSAGSFWKLERALREHGYEVFNPTYDSTHGYIEDHAEQLATSLENYLQDTQLEFGKQPQQISFIGHSMGGLVIRYYLQQPKAVTPDSCVYIATPHRGAQLTDKRMDNLFFKLILGSEAALQLSPEHEFYSKLDDKARGEVGILYGGMADDEGRNDDVDGDDDHTVSVVEAQLPGAKDACRLPYNHTFLTFVEDSITQVLHFLKHRKFQQGEGG